PRPVAVVLRCRAGLERVALDEFEPDLAPRLRHDAPGGLRIAVTLTGPLERLFRARTTTSFAFELPEVPVAAPGAAPEALADAVTAALTSAEARAIIAHYTPGAARYRLAWARGGKRRALIYRIAAA